MHRRFVSACAITVFAGGLVLGVAQVRAQGKPPSDNPGTPFAAILAKLDALIGAVGPDVSSKLDLTLAYLDFFNGGNIVGAWSRTYPISTRFFVLDDFNAEAFLDRETGLVWIDPAPPVISPGRSRPRRGLARRAPATTRLSGGGEGGGRQR